MADQETMNGGDQTLEITQDEDLKSSKLMQKIEVLELEKSELVRDNKAVRERNSNLETELKVLEDERATLEREIAKSDTDKKSLELVAARAAELEIEVVELKREVEKLKEIGGQKGHKLDVLEKERALLLEKLSKVENEKEEEVRKWKKKLEGLEERESGEKVKMSEKENEIRELKKKVENLELVAAKNDEKMGTVLKAREVLEGEKSGLERLLKKAEESVKDLKEKTLDGINGIHLVEDGEKGIDGMRLTWPIVAASAGVVVTVGALWYVRSRQR